MPKISAEQIKVGDRVRVHSDLSSESPIVVGLVTEAPKTLKCGSSAIYYTVEGENGEFWAYLSDVVEVLPQPWREGCGGDLRGVFYEKHGGDPLADILLAMDHQLSTDSDLDEITGALKYQALRVGIKDAMAKKLGYAGVVS